MKEIPEIALFVLRIRKESGQPSVPREVRRGEIENVSTKEVRYFEDGSGLLQQLGQMLLNDDFLNDRTNRGPRSPPNHVSTKPAQLCAAPKTVSPGASRESLFAL